MPGVPDTKVLELANSKKAILVTADKDFGELVYRQNLVSYGVVLIRLAGSSPAEKAEIVGPFIRDHQDELTKAFSVITKNGVRIRQANLTRI
jgi:predicted nuclease of predicted toxin-antitoxin system